MGSDGAPGRDSPVPPEIVRESGRTRVTRLSLPDGTVIRKEPLGPDGERRVRRETAVLGRLRGVAGVAQLAGGPEYPGSVVLADAGRVSLASAAKPLAVDELTGLAVRLGRAVAGMRRRRRLHQGHRPGGPQGPRGGARRPDLPRQSPGSRDTPARGTSFDAFWNSPYLVACPFPGFSPGADSRLPLANQRLIFHQQALLIRRRQRLASGQEAAHEVGRLVGKGRDIRLRDARLRALDRTVGVEASADMRAAVHEEMPARAPFHLEPQARIHVLGHGSGWSGIGHAN